MSPRRGPWRSAGFRRLWAASASANLADGVTAGAAPLLAVQLTDDPVLVAGVVVAQRLPWFLFTLPSGVVVDRVDRRLVLAAANALRALALAGLAAAVWADWGGLAVLYAATFVLGTAETLVDNASIAVLPAVVDDEDLDAANGRVFTTMSVADELVGPPIGSALFAVLRATPFALAAVAFAAAAGWATRLRGDLRPVRPAGERTGLWAELGQGLSWFLRNRVIRTASLWGASFNFFDAATTGVLVLVAIQRLGLREGAYGVLLTAMGVGGALGGLWAERVIARFGASRIVIGGILCTSLAYALVAVTTEPVLVGLALAVKSAVDMAGNVVVHSLRQRAVPAHLLGRVTSVYRLPVMGALPLGGVAGGALAGAFGLTAPFWVAAVGSLLLIPVLAPVLTDRALRDAGTSTEPGSDADAERVT